MVGSRRRGICEGDGFGDGAGGEGTAPRPAASQLALEAGGATESPTDHPTLLPAIPQSRMMALSTICQGSAVTCSLTMLYDCGLETDGLRGHAQRAPPVTLNTVTLVIPQPLVPCPLSVLKIL